MKDNMDEILKRALAPDEEPDILPEPPNPVSGKRKEEDYEEKNKNAHSGSRCSLHSVGAAL